jgi:hypothetical protein
MRRQQRSQRADKRKQREPVPFAGVDGEGGDIDGTHEYLLLRAGRHLLETGKPLTPYECFAFLADLPKDRIYVSFAFDYDVTMMIRRLPPSRVAALFERKKRAIRDPKTGKETGQYYPVSVGGGLFQIDYMPHKEFKVRRKGGKWTTISDTFTFFQSSFVRALRKWFDDSPQYSDHIDRIAVGKEMRHDFGEVTEDEREYNALECVMLELLMERFRDLCTQLDIFPRKWQGPGNLVTAVFRREGLPSKFDIRVPLDVWKAANAAYYGGRFEASTYGLIQGPVYQYDINSAYASHYRDLPCLQHGRWEPITSLPDDNSIFFATVRFHHRNEATWYTVPVRSEKGTLLFPRTGAGTYWCHELNVLRQYADIEVESGFRYIRRCDCRNFDWVYALYDERDRVGKDSGRGKVLKTVLATIYGKLAQSKGHPIFANPIWSGLIVSHCRAKLVTAALQMEGGRDVLMLATDGLFCTTRRNLTVGSDLGEWTLEEHESLFIIQSGLYLMPDVSPKTRGVPQSKIMQYDSTFRELWDEWLETFDLSAVPFVNIPLRVFVSARLAHARRKTWMAGKWREEHKKVRFDWRTKRARPRVVGSSVVTLPVDGHPELRSLAPTWQIGGELEPERLLIEDQPDWGDTLVDA